MPGPGQVLLAGEDKRGAGALASSILAPVR